MRRLLLAGALACVLAGCVPAWKPNRGPDDPPQVPPSTPVTLTPQQVEAVQAAFRRVLKDPESARFGGQVAGRDSKGVIWVCGTVNAKNSFGGYTGIKPYIAGVEGNLAKIGPVANDQVDAEFIENTCLAKGLIIPGL